MSSMRPVRWSRARRQRVDHTVIRRDDDVGQRARRARRFAACRAAWRRRARRSCCCRAAVVAVLFLLANLADHLIRRAVEHQRLVEDRTLAEQLLGHVEADNRHPRHLLFVGPREVPARTPARSSGSPGTAARSPLTRARRRVIRALDRHCGPFELGADDGNHRRVGGQRPGIVERQDDLAAGAFAAGLQAGAAAPDDGDVPAEFEQDLVVAAAEPFAGRGEHDNRNHPPEDPEHRQDAAQLVGAQVLERLDDGFLHVPVTREERPGRLP